MDKKELLKTTLRGEEVPYILSGFWHHFEEGNLHGKKAVQAHIDFFQAVDPDMIKVMNEYSFRLDREVTDISDWKELKAVPFDQTPYAGYLDEVKAIQGQLPNSVPIIATLHGVLVSGYHATEKPGFFSNPDNMISRHLRNDPEAVSHGLEIISDTLIELCSRLAAIGVDAIYYAALGGESYRFAPALFESYVRPYDEKVINAINDLGMISMLHICKDQVMLPLYAGIKADVVNWAIHECEYGLKEGRALFGDATILGGFDDRSGVLVDGSKEAIEREVEAIIATAGKKRFIVGADCTLPNDVELWRVKTAIEHARRV